MGEIRGPEVLKGKQSLTGKLRKVQDVTNWTYKYMETER